MNILTVDPSINSLGFAYFEENSLKEFGTIQPDLKFIDSGPTLHWTQKALSIYYKYQAYFSDINPNRIVIEMPTVWHGTLRAHTAKNSGALEKLFFVVGLLCSYQPEKVILITPNEWKGQLPKHVTLQRVLEKFPNVSKNTSPDAIDAIGLGMYYLSHQRGIPTEFEHEQARLLLADRED